MPHVLKNLWDNADKMREKWQKIIKQIQISHKLNPNKVGHLEIVEMAWKRSLGRTLVSYGPRLVKSCLGFQQRRAKTSLLSYRDMEQVL